MLPDAGFYTFPGHTGTNVPLKKDVLSGYLRYDPAGTGGLIYENC